MIPIALDPAALPVAIAGRGALALRRFQALRAAGAGAVLLFSDLPDAELADAAGEFWRDALPKPNDLAALKVLWIVRLSDDAAADLAALARSHRVLVNVEDRPALCDFHSVAEVRRGSLLLTVSTGGARRNWRGSTGRNGRNARRRSGACERRGGATIMLRLRFRR
jgi:precorrin-2 dehydrogenase/sirohydrochlorin ferrochelatase